jgi:cyclopropane fatty-acyl-phospholipid synthase-like methyltransferase
MLSWRAELLNLASRPYLKAGPGLFPYCFARGKLRADPVYRALLERGLLVGRPRILDLGCGQGLLFAWLHAAARVHDLGIWPPSWPVPPRPTSLRGIELKAREVQRAHRALGPDAGIETGDIRDAEFGAVDAVVVLDVLHYLEPQAQCDVLRRVRAALPAGGLLLLRVGDAASGLRSRFSQWVDTVVVLLRDHAWARQHCRSVGEWQSMLREAGFTSEALPMSQGTPFANVLLIAGAAHEPV